jgi:hypothetical protein
MKDDLLDNWVPLQRAATASVMHLGRLGVRRSERFAQHQLNAIRLALEGNRKQVRELTRGGGAWAILAHQPQLAAEIGIQVLEHALETLEILIDTRRALHGWLQDEFNTLRVDPIFHARWQAAPALLDSTESRCLH